MKMFVIKTMPWSYDSDYKIKLMAGYSIQDFKCFKNSLIKCYMYNEFYARHDSLREAQEAIEHIKIELGCKNDS